MYTQGDCRETLILRKSKMKLTSCILLLVTGMVVVAAVLPACSIPVSGDAESEKMIDTVINTVMAYIKGNHPDAAPYIKADIHWSRIEMSRKPGYSGYSFKGDGWMVKIGHPIVADDIYDIRAEYEAAGITWVGLYKNGAITEESYSHLTLK